METIKDVAQRRAEAKAYLEATSGLGGMTVGQTKGDHGVCETVMVNGADGPVAINKHEHDVDVHGPVIEPKAAKKDGAETKKPTAK